MTEVIIRNQTSRNHLSPDKMHWEEQHHFLSIPVKNVSLESNNKKYFKLELGNFLKKQMAYTLNKY